MKNNRLDLVINQLNEKGIDSLLVCDPSSIDYLIGYHNEPGERMYVLLINKDGKLTLFMNNLFYLDQELDLEIVWYGDTDDYVSILSQYLLNSKVVGVDKYWPAKFLLSLMDKVESKFVNGSICVDYIRMKKDKDEQDLMRESSRLNDLAIDKAIEYCALGNLSEKEVTNKLPAVYESLGCSGFSFGAIVGYGKNAADNHHVGDDTLVKPGDSIVIDMGGLYNGYCSDMTRTVFYKEVSDKQKYVYNLVRQANEAAEALIKPGVKLCDIDKTARDIIAKGGYIAEFNHRLGHFIGRDVHEYGDVSAAFDMPVEEGMIFSIEPGVYIQGEFGVRIEDLVLVTKDGCEVLNHYTKDLLVIGN